MQASFPPLRNNNCDSNRAISRQAWLSSPGWDTLWILSPAFLSTAFVFLARNQIATSQNIPLWVWVCFVLLIDVAHVYATLFRTYLSPQAFAKNKAVLLAMPMVAWIGGSLLYALDGIYFWRALAYLAVFHFIRQQFGFIVLYSRRDPEAMKKFKWLDGLAIYLATLYPILFWHSNMPRNFSWFVAGDFLESMPAIITKCTFVVYVIVMASFVIKEIVLFKKTSFFNIPRSLLIVGTALSWWTGIITFNSDMAFTITNVVSHGVPYMALVWLYHHGTAEAQSEVASNLSKSELQNKSGHKSDAQCQSNSEARAITNEKSWSNFPRILLSNVLFFFAFLALMAYLEEGLWDGLIWREHLSIFALFSNLPVINDSAILALLVPFLALPQSTHYLLDGFIWRVKERNSTWSA
ncbi:hypothetical protein BH11CYA1_BH11CYA1_19750 [soil metagenome]